MAKVVGLFDDAQSAQGALQMLNRMGGRSESISVVASKKGGHWTTNLESLKQYTKPSLTGATIANRYEVVIGGPITVALHALLRSTPINFTYLVAQLTNMGIPKIDAEVYAESVRLGSSLILATAKDTAEAERTLGILDRFHPVAMDKRRTLYLSVGWISVGIYTCQSCNEHSVENDDHCRQCGQVLGLSKEVLAEDSHLPNGLTVQIAAAGDESATGATHRLAIPPVATVTLQCPYCAHAVASTARFCSSCGKSLVFSFAPFSPGTSLSQGQYTITRALSRGGMGAIYLAKDHRAFDREVVIKALLDYFDPTNPVEVHAARVRFQQEAKTLATLRHAAIPQIYTFFEDGQHNYIVMEYVEGPNLEQRLTHQDAQTGQTVRGAPLPIRQVIQWGITLCRVLEYLATIEPEPVIHHDIKPANLLLDRVSQDVHLVDFGTARARLSKGHVGTVGIQKSSIYGTQGYAPPEQYGGRSKPKSDVYALAATLYHLATDDDPGKHPFDFPLLGDLGRFGRKLQVALDKNVDSRPTAAEFRRQLEEIAQPTKPIPIRTGELLHNAHDLVAWCEKNWAQAMHAITISQGFPEQIEANWRDTDLADKIRATIKSHPQNAGVAVDAMLALLDPQSYAKAPSVLTVSTGQLVFGSDLKQKHQKLTLMNRGRRFITGYIEVPSWLSATPKKLALAPGENLVIELAVQSMKQPSGNGTFKIRVQSGTTTLATVQLQWSNSPRPKIQGQSPKSLSATPKLQNSAKPKDVPPKLKGAPSKPHSTLPGQQSVASRQQGTASKSQNPASKPQSIPPEPSAHLGDLRFKWPRIIENIRRIDPFVAGLLQGAEPAGVSGQIVTLATPHEWKVEPLEKANAQKVIGGALHDVLGFRVQIEVIVRRSPS